MATAPIRPLAWDPPYATGVAQEMAKRQKKKKKKKKSGVPTPPTSIDTEKALEKMKTPLLQTLNTPEIERDFLNSLFSQLVFFVFSFLLLNIGNFKGYFLEFTVKTVLL